MKKYIIIATMLMLSVPTLVGCGKEKVSTKGGASANATQKIASGENLTIPVKEISEKASFYSVEVDGSHCSKGFRWKYPYGIQHLPNLLRFW